MHSLAATYSDVEEILHRANLILGGETDPERFVTMLFVRLDPRARTLTYSSAGHPTAYVLNGLGDVKAMLSSTSFPLGVELDARFPAGNPTTLQPGDIAVLFTDGLIEASSANGKPFGRDRVIQVVARHRGETAIAIIAALYETVTDFSGGKKLDDDITIVVIKVEARGD